MTGFHALVALFAAYMLVKHGPRAVRLLRGGGPKLAALLELLNVVLAIVILAVALEGLWREARNP